MVLSKSQLRERVAARKAEIGAKDGIISRLQARLDTPHWGDDDTGYDYAIGDRRRYLTNTYVCVKAHSHALTRRPTDDEYWLEVED